MILRFLILCFLVFLSSINATAQEEIQIWQSQKAKLIAPNTDSLLVDSLAIDRSSIRISHMKTSKKFIDFHLSGKTFTYVVFDEQFLDTLRIEYISIALPLLNGIIRNKDTSLFLPQLNSGIQRTYSPLPVQSFQPFEGLNSKGSISRAISVGSNQDAVLTSTLNLQLSGKLGKNTELRASITDNSIPVQSDGYSQQLREFDRAYIELENKDFGLIKAGDFNITENNSYFLQFDKRISGAGLFSNIPLTNGNIPLQLEGGIARGRFTRNRFKGQEGNQGPYKLTGANGERFVIIISGSEKVYVDGILMKRGEQFDYIMDYNAGEIIFTSLQPITKEKRIAVEFQYSEQNFLRSVGFAKTGFQNERFKTTLQFYSEQDSKNQSLVQDLSDFEKAVLANAGDDIDNALVSTIAPSEFVESLILYQLKDSIGFDSVLVFSVDSNQNLFQATFSFLGPNSGNYELSQNNANGRVFEWVAPINGVLQGSYEPIKKLIAPNQLQVITLQTEAKISKNQSVFMDFALSKNDINLFSEVGKANDLGAAGKFKYALTGKWKKLNWFSHLNFEFNQSSFQTVERIRRVEFARDWNLPLNYNGAAQISGLQLGVTKNLSKIVYGFDVLNINQYLGFQNKLSAKHNGKKNHWVINGSWLNSTDSVKSSNFAREQFLYQYNLQPNIWVGLRSIGEWNLQKVNATDTTLASSYSFLQNQFYTGFGDTASNYVELFYGIRTDDTAKLGALNRFSRAETWGLKSSFKTSFQGNLQLFINNRNLKIFLPIERSIEQTLTSRINYTQRFLKNTIISTTFYETGAGSEAKRSFSYIEVPAGTGIYTHTDYNGNGLQELDEFEIAPTPDQARFIRIFTPSTDYIRTNLNKFGQNLNLQSPFSWKEKSGLRKLLSHFSLLLNYQLNRKTLLDGSVNTLNPFESIANDTLIVSMNQSSRGSLFYNRSSSIFGFDYTYLSTDNRNLLSFGVEQQSAVGNSINLRYRFIEPLILRSTVSYENKINSSQNFPTRNFTIDGFDNLISLTYQTGLNLLITSSFKWQNQEGTGDNPTVLNQNDFGLDLSYKLAESINLKTQINYILNQFDGNSNSPVAFDMLDGLKPGKNTTWNLVLQKTLRKNILISLSYNGRVSESILPIHTGSLQVKAFF